MLITVYSKVLDTKPSEEVWDFQVVWRSQRSLPDEKPITGSCSASSGEAPSHNEGFQTSTAWVKSYNEAQNRANLQQFSLTLQTLSSDLIH